MIRFDSVFRTQAKDTAQEKSKKIFQQKYLCFFIPAFI